MHGTQRMDIAEARSSPRERDRIASLMDMVPVDVTSALDVGARDGYLSIELTKKAGNVVALDLMPTRIDHPRITAVAGDVTRLAFADETFDLVLCAEVLEHIASPVLEVACRELLRVSRRCVLIGVPYLQDTRVGRLTCQACGHHNPPWGHVSTFDEARLAGLFEGATVAKIAFSGENRDCTNPVSAALNDWAGNPWGPYWQEEGCVACGARMLPPANRGPLGRLASKAAFMLNALQKHWVEPRATWIHMLFTKDR